MKKLSNNSEFKLRLEQLEKEFLGFLIDLLDVHIPENPDPRFLREYFKEVREVLKNMDRQFIKEERLRFKEYRKRTKES